MDGSRPPEFFKVLLSGFSKQMMIPPEFTRHIWLEEHRKATILSPLGKFWHVELKRRGGNVFFVDGWEEFTRAHNFGVGFFLVFRYEGNMVFTLRVYDHSCCEKVYTADAGGGSSSNELASIVECGGLAEVEDDDGEEDSDEEDDEDGEDYCEEDDEDYAEEEEKEEEEVEEEEEEEEEVEVEEEEEEEEVEVEVEEEEENINEDYKDSRVNRNPNNIFVSVMHEYNMKCNKVVVPKEFCKFHGLNKEQGLVLKDEKGRSWLVQFRPSKGYSLLRGGWANFSSANDLQVRDICTFELVSKREMHVTIQKHK